jgi:hypothetical protein
METISTKSRIKLITGGSVPTTSTLAKGEFAYGVIGGVLRYFGNTGSAVVELTPAGIAAGSITEAQLVSALQSKINNVLQKNNTTSFTPTADYHPATKKYADDKVAAATTSLTAIAAGKTTTLVFDTKTQLDQFIAGTYSHPSGIVKAGLKVGDNLLIKALNVPDYWWDGTAIAELETDTDLTDYYDSDDTDAAIAAAIDASAASGGGIKVSNHKLELDTDNITVTLTVEEI